ncbi:carbohydrate ABC transporter permease [Mesoplasma lactucae]|uniref:carbohydrate ABC transporter permease n=1 Tax=Mesoplasma lactucae TaxID=138853 RepID=UPI001474C60B|nr:sugar ABC transporter permease [Mesoplasma lactucae]
MLPAVILILLFIAYPLFIIFKNGFNSVPVSGDFIGGWYQFHQIFTDKNFLWAIANTVIYAAIAIPISLFISIIIAKGISKVWHPRILQSAFFMPFLASSLALGMVFQTLFNPMGFTSQVQTKALLILYGVFQTLPFRVIMFTTAYMAIDQRMYKAAKADGMRWYQIFWRIDLSEIAPIILYTLTTGIISAFKFIPFGLFTDYNSAIAHGGQTMVYYIYAQINEIQNYGKASAASIILIIIVLILTIANALIWREKKHAKNK